jgi:hypothetical protein
MGPLRIGALITLIFWAQPILAQNHALLVDRSGSMKPYYQRNLVMDLAERIQTIFNDHGSVQLIAFSTDVRSVNNPKEINQLPWGSFTYLDRAIDHAIQRQYDIAWMITDNIQDQPNAPEAGNTEVFYQRLRGESIKKVAIMPLLQPPGMPGIVIYAALLSPDANDLYEKEIADFLKSVKGVYRTEALRMKPLDRDTIDINVVRSSLLAKKDKPYQEGQIISESFELRFKSKFDHLKIVDAKIEVPKAEADFGSGSLLKPEKMEITITPVIVKSLDPRGETKEIYSVTLDLGKVRLKRGFASMWRAAFGGKSKEELALRLRFLINVPQQNWKFKDQFLRDYNASNLALARATGKIYGIENLPSLLGEETTVIAAETQIPLEVKYPWWPAVLLVALFLALAAAFVGGGWYLATYAGDLFATKRWSVKAETESGSVVTSKIDEHEVIVQSSVVGEVRRNRFFPAEGVIILDPDEEKKSISLEEGLRLKLKLARGGTFVLTFETAKEGQEEGASYTPRRR